MLRKFLNALRGMARSSELESYYMGLIERGLPGGPTADQARGEYLAVTQAKAWALLAA